MNNKAIVFIMVCVISMTSLLYGAAPNPADPTLRLWLKADDLSSAYNPGDAVNQWVDASSYGTIFAPDAAWDEAPHYAEITVNPPTVVSAIRLDASGDSMIPGTRDRLWQINNLAPNSDPLNMGAGQSMTVIVVYSNSAVDGWLGPYMPLVTKRGTSSCVWMFGDHSIGSTSQLYYVTYSDPLVYYSGSPYISLNRWNVSAMTIDASDTLNFYQDGDQNDAVDLQLTASSPQSIIGRNASTAEPAGIACHSQSCCGRGETFAGYIAEIIIYSRVLSPTEVSDMEEYLTTKYFEGEVQLDTPNPVDPNKIDYRPAFCGDKGTIFQLADLSENCYTDFTDFAQIASQWLMTSSLTVTEWNYADDFSIADGNPNSVWSYGYFDGSNNFVRYNQLGTPPAPLINWTWNGNPDINGNANKNTDMTNSYIRTDWGPGMGWRPGQCCIMTPLTNLAFKPAGRFTVPVSGIYNISITFENRVVNNGQPSGVFVRVGDSEVFNATVTGYESGLENYADYTNSLNLSAGQTITFGVYALTGQGLAYDGGLHQVGVQAIISGPPVELMCDEANEYSIADLNTDCKVDLTDLSIFVSDWLDCTALDNQSCGSYVDIAQQRATDEMQLWIQAKFSGSTPKPPISFLYGPASSKRLLDTWVFNRTQEQLDANRTKWTLTYTDSSSGLVTTCQAIEYHDYPAVEWVVYFENSGAQDTPVLSAVQAADYGLTSRSTGPFMLYYANGSSASASDFQPQQAEIGLNDSLSFASFEGRSSGGGHTPDNPPGVMPFFNLAEPDNTGVIVAIGWSGQWAASFTRNVDRNIKVRAGMELTNLKLHPGERIRTPAMLQMFWAGNPNRGQNQFRRLILDHYSPRPGGVLVDPPIAASVHATYCFECTTEANMIQFIDELAAHNFPVDYFWIDAGWYNLNGTSSWVNVGTWEPDPVRFPNGMEPVADEVHSLGYKFLLWFEPERVTNGSWLMNNHSDWVFTNGDDWPLLNLGNPDALAWAKSTFSDIIGQWGIDVYRHDFNVFPLSAWRAGEAADRQGMNEIRHIMGLYEYFDYLQAQHPNLIIDNCASGGRRIDFEMLKRAVTLTRTDYLWYSDSAHAMQYALSDWIPLTGLGCVSTNAYDFRSGMGSNFVTAFNNNDGSMWAPAIAQLNMLYSIRHLFSGDFYPLTGYSLGDDVWMAWQYDRPELDEGLIQAFRRANSTVSSMTFKLKGLDSSSVYALTNLDVAGTTTATGSDLMNTGLTVNLPTARSSAIITYSRN